MKIGVPSGFIVIQMGRPCVLPVSVDVDRLEVMMSFYLRKTVKQGHSGSIFPDLALACPRGCQGPSCATGSSLLLPRRDSTSSGRHPEPWLPPCYLMW
jgi:hypothetical protein